MKLKYVGLAVASLLLSGQAMSLWAWDCVLGQVRPQCPANQNQLQLRGRRSSLPQASPREPTQPHSCLSLPFWFRLLPLTLSLTLLSPHPPSPLSLDPLSIHLLLCCCCPQPHRHHGKPGLQTPARRHNSREAAPNPDTKTTEIRGDLLFSMMAKALKNRNGKKA